MAENSAKKQNDVSILIIGGGFYGCCLALCLRSITDSIAVIEAGDQIMTRASRVNQARVHTGFHYPRSMLTAVKSMVLHRRFSEEFPQAVSSDFRMLYGVARHGSRVPVARFWRMFHEMGAPIQRASASQSALFNPDMVEAVFDCTESAFDYSVLRTDLMTRMDALNMDLQLNTEVSTLSEDVEGVTVGLSNRKNDWRPILGGRIHKIYNLVDLIRTNNTAWAAADLHHLLPKVCA